MREKVLLSQVATLPTTYRFVFGGVVSRPQSEKNKADKQEGPSSSAYGSAFADLPQSSREDVMSACGWIGKAFDESRSTEMSGCVSLFLLRLLCGVVGPRSVGDDDRRGKSLGPAEARDSPQRCAKRCGRTYARKRVWDFLGDGWCSA